MARLELESFEPALAPPPLPPEPTLESEEARLAAFEQGYTAGWDDAVAAQDAEVSRLRGELGRNLQELSFTYHEARAHVLRALEPLLADMAAKVLPAVARQALGAIVLEQLRPIAETLAETPIEVTVAPASRRTVEAALTGTAGPPFRLVEEPDLGEGQVYLRLGQVERKIDLDRVIAAIEAAIASYFHPEAMETADG